MAATMMREVVAAGEYASASEVMREALRPSCSISPRIVPLRHCVGMMKSMPNASESPTCREWVLLDRKCERACARSQQVTRSSIAGSRTARRSCALSMAHGSGKNCSSRTTLNLWQTKVSQYLLTVTIVRKNRSFQQ